MKKRIWYYFLPAAALLLLWGAFALGHVRSAPVRLTTDKPVAPASAALQGGDAAASADTSQAEQVRQAAADMAGEAVCINTASAAELEALPGIGPVLAQRIVDDRAANGPFASKEDLLRVEGIGEKTLEAILDEITLE